MNFNYVYYARMHATLASTRVCIGNTLASMNSTVVRMLWLRVRRTRVANVL